MVPGIYVRFQPYKVYHIFRRLATLFLHDPAGEIIDGAPKKRYDNKTVDERWN